MQRPQGKPFPLLLLDLQHSPLGANLSLARSPWVFTAFGFIPQDHARPTGFKGQYLENSTGHYLLGNGYRAYNPVLMRFNTPDKLSPFSAGGLSTYGFALNDPINNADPTGETPQKKTYKYIGAARRIKGDINVFLARGDESNQLELNLIAHGKPGFIGSPSRWYNPKELIKRLKKEGYSPRNQPINIFACHTANRTGKSSTAFIQTLAKLTGQRVIGFENKVTTRAIDYPINKIKIDALEELMLDKYNFRPDSHMLFFSVHTTNPDPKNPDFSSFSYSPMVASPLGEMISLRQS